MMKKLLISSFILMSISGCKTKNSSQVKNSDNVLSEMQKGTYIIYDKLLGSFTGAFGDNTLTLLISRAVNDSVLGSAMFGDFYKPFAGTIKREGSAIIFNAKEIGNDTNKGVFNFTMDGSNTNVIKGSWVPDNNTSGNTKSYILERKNFTYHPSAGEFKGSQKLLHTSDVENLLQNELEIMRNEIFARHGYCFNDKELRTYFEAQDWYIPNKYNVKNELSQIEKNNIALIMRYEKYSREHGDDFGR